MNSLFRLEEGNLTISCMVSRQKQPEQDKEIINLNLPPISEAFVSMGQEEALPRTTKILEFELND